MRAHNHVDAGVDRLARRLGVTPSTVYNWERGNWEPRVSQLRQLANLFSVRMDDIKLADSPSTERGGGTASEPSRVAA